MRVSFSSQVASRSITRIASCVSIAANSRPTGLAISHAVRSEFNLLLPICGSCGCRCTPLIREKSLVYYFRRCPRTGWRDGSEFLTDGLPFRNRALPHILPEVCFGEPFGKTWCAAQLLDDVPATNHDQ